MDSIIGKVLIVGNVATGKTSLIRRYVHGFFIGEHKTTIGVDFSLKSIHLNSFPSDINLQLWDIAGQERFHGLTRIYYKDAVAAVVVFDLTDRSTFDAALKWKEDIDSKVFLKNGETIPVLLIGNKCDLQGQCCDDAAITAIAKRSGFIGWCKTSAKDNINIQAAFEAIASKIGENEARLRESGMNQFVESSSRDDIVLLKKTNNEDNNLKTSKANVRNKSSCC